MNNKISLIAIAVALALDIFLWRSILGYRPVSVAHAYILDVGQGDSEMMVFSPNIKVMTDAGPSSKVLASMARVLSPDDRYIDIAIISHPDSDHFGGYNYLLDNYNFGAFIYNGRSNSSGAKSEWDTMMAKMRSKNIPLITLGRGDSINYKGNVIDIISPNRNLDRSTETNDTSIVEHIKTPFFTALFTGDATFSVENFLLGSGDDLRADLLKVAHHGSKYASGDAFLRAVDPRVAAIGVGLKNTYGHPSKETLQRLASSTHAAIFRTDQNGTIDIWPEGNTLRVKTEL